MQKKKVLTESKNPCRCEAGAGGGGGTRPASSHPSQLQPPAASGPQPWRWNKEEATSEVWHNTCTSSVSSTLPKSGRSPASARCSSACPDRSEAPAGAPSPPLSPRWVYGRPSPETELRHRVAEEQPDSSSVLGCDEPLTSTISLISLCVSSLSSLTCAVPIGLSLRRKPLQDNTRQQRHCHSLTVTTLPPTQQTYCSSYS